MVRKELEFDPWVREFTLQSRDALPHRHGPLAGKLAQGHLQQEDGDPGDAQHGQVGDQKGSCKDTQLQLNSSTDMAGIFVLQTLLFK